MPLPTYAHQQGKTPVKDKGAKKNFHAVGKSTQKLNKTRKLSKKLSSTKLATELFRSPATTPVKTPKVRPPCHAPPRKGPREAAPTCNVF